MAYWLYTANTKYYDVLGAFSANSAYWPVKSKVAIGDKVLIYLAAPYKQIGFATEVVQIELELQEVFASVSPFFKRAPDNRGNGRLFMELVNIKTIELEEHAALSLDRLRQAGLKGMLMGPRNLNGNPELLEYIKGNLS